MVSDLSLDENNELRILDHLSKGQTSHPGKKHTIQLLDHFEHEGPNDIHPCLVLELLGPNAKVTADGYERRRLPGAVAREASCKRLSISTIAMLRREVSQKYSSLDNTIIKVTDLSPRNIVFANTRLQHQSTADLSASLGEPWKADVIASYGYHHTPNIPDYLVAPTSLPFQKTDVENCMVKVLGFGQTCLWNKEGRMPCRLNFQAPEALLTNRWDSRADIWSLGCTVLALRALSSKLLTRSTDFRNYYWIFFS